MTIFWAVLCRDKCGDPQPNSTRFLPSGCLCTFGPAQRAHLLLREEHASPGHADFAQEMTVWTQASRFLSVLCWICRHSPACPLRGPPPRQLLGRHGLVCLVLVPGPGLSSRLTQARLWAPWPQPLCSTALEAAARGRPSVLPLPWPRRSPGTASVCPQPRSLKHKCSRVGQGAQAPGGSGPGRRGWKRAHQPVAGWQRLVVNQPLCLLTPGLPPVGAERVLGGLSLPGWWGAGTTSCRGCEPAFETGSPPDKCRPGREHPLSECARRVEV